MPRERDYHAEYVARTERAKELGYSGYGERRKEYEQVTKTIDLLRIQDKEIVDKGASKAEQEKQLNELERTMKQSKDEVIKDRKQQRDSGKDTEKYHISRNSFNKLSKQVKNRSALWAVVRSLSPGVSIAPK